jgi:hypothetical protein
MKNTIRIALITLITLITGSKLIAQDDVIITSTDTLRNVAILSSEEKTNSKMISFLDQDGNEIGLTSDEVIGYYKENLLYKSKKVNYSNGQIKQEFVQLIFSGDVDLYYLERVDEKGKKSDNYLMSNADDAEVVSLIPHKNNLDNFCTYYLPQYEAFKETDSFKKSIREVEYSYNSLATFTSYYNHFINPEKYKATKYKKKVKVGHFIGIAFVGIVTVVSIKVINKAKDNNDDSII